MPAPQQQTAQRPKSARERNNEAYSGAAAAACMYGTKDPNADAADAKASRPSSRHVGPKDEGIPASEFLSGPSKPGKCTHGVRRFESYDKDQVGRMLTDEYFMSEECRRAQNGGAGAGNGKPKHSAQREHLNNACGVTERESNFRSGVRMTHTDEPMDAPFFEDNDPKPPRDPAPLAGKRHFADQLKPVNPYREVDRLEKERAARERGELPPEPVKSNRSGKANKSVNVIDLGSYTAAELGEPQKNHGQYGPRKWTAPDPPPRKKPSITLINSSAKAEHDVLGNGRFGKPETPPVSCKGKGACRPPRDTANLFGGAPKRREMPPPKPRASNAPVEEKKELLRYYDPTVDNADDFKIPPPKVAPSKNNVESTGDERPRPTGKAPARYSCNRDETPNSWGQS